MSARALGIQEWASSALWRLVVLSVLWWGLIEGDMSVAYYGLVVVPLAAAASMGLHRPRPDAVGSWPRRTLAAVSLLRWFIWRSILGGVDVARRAVSRPVDLDPGFVEYELALPTGLGRLAVIDLASLMPGTLSAELEGDVLRVHLLHTEMPGLELVAELEARVGRVTGWDPGQPEEETDSP
ncbi:Na+/H+ antiporter subunit E [Phytoactinopolyspora mesophila]|uniref:Cation transporter n=1 Tax=Phytoactinopolyspora mesophila TaxID=2650750 RepID=A0A7K3M3Q3_9ACTN|nr:Na+/H+ antiporter subunit E [Phytoactinopolyspora mesophila]NDL57939.1 cation transporter [Phytoactinopolyspora mesophila]